MKWHRLALLALLPVVTLPSIPAVAQDSGTLDRYPGESRLFLLTDGDSIKITGWVRDLGSSEPATEAMVYVGTSGTLTNERGWFRLALDADAFPLDLNVEKLSWEGVTLHLTPSLNTMQFFVQRLDIPLGCENIRTSGAPEPPRNEVMLHLRNVAMDEPVSGNGAVRLQRLEDGEVTDAVIAIVDGDLRLPVSRYGVYKVDLRVPGFEPWQLYPLAVGVDVCDPRHIRSVEQSGWLVPTR